MSLDDLAFHAKRPLGQRLVNHLRRNHDVWRAELIRVNAMVACEPQHSR